MTESSTDGDRAILGLSVYSDLFELVLLLVVIVVTCDNNNDLAHNTAVSLNLHHS
jgi:hypothetical protein